MRPGWDGTDGDGWGWMEKDGDGLGVEHNNTLYTKPSTPPEEPNRDRQRETVTETDIGHGGGHEIRTIERPPTDLAPNLPPHPKFAA